MELLVYCCVFFIHQFNFHNCRFIFGLSSSVLFTVENKRTYCVSCTQGDPSKKQRSLYKVSHQKQYTVNGQKENVIPTLHGVNVTRSKNIIMLFQNGSERMVFLAVAPSRTIERKTISRTVCSKTI